MEIQAPNVRLAGFIKVSAVLGSATCASANCHGSAEPNTPAWKSAFSTFVAHDPHTQAYDVLFTTRSREMTRLLAGQHEPLSDEAHLQAIQERCTDCHVTTTESTASAGQGVQCESCHGAANHWLHTHDRTGFSRSTAGFVDTKSLARRAKTCLACHSGHQVPTNANAPAHVVNHDLIAAGHPRLTFDLRTYLESLPDHWDRTADHARHAPAPRFKTWLVGMQQAAALENQRANGQPPDFAQLDCFACHHALSADSWRQPVGLDVLSPPRWPPSEFLAIEENRSLAARAAWTGRFVNAAGRERRWDAAVQALQAVEALRADSGSNVPESAVLDAGVTSLRNYLAIDCFSSEITSCRRPTAYDSPTSFNPALLEPHLQAVQRSLSELQAAGGSR
jgi:predicted CxxxxCH...CXXCH cytochrome family protein